MAEIAWTLEAQRWLEDIFEYIVADNPQAAARSALMPHNLAVVSDAAASALLHGVPRPPRRTLPR